MQRIQLQVTRRYIGAEGHMREGQFVTVDPKRARQLIDGNLCKVVVGPTETKAAEPKENNTKKSSSTRRGGRSTRTASSSASGKATPSSASPAAPVLLDRNANTSHEYNSATPRYTP